MTQIEFGWRVPAFPVDGSKDTEFRQQIMDNLRQIQGKFASAWVADHFVPWHGSQPAETDTLECLSSINFLAGAFPQLDFGSVVLCQSYRNPALLAKMAATLQLLSGGRFILGIGAGWKADEYRAYNYEFPAPAVRIRQLEETVEIVKRLWTESPASYEGQYYRIENAYCEPRPNPRPIVMIGGGGEQLTLRVVAKHADWWNFPGGSLENYKHKLDVLRRHCDEVGRDYDQIRKTWASEQVAVAATEEEARRMAAASPFPGLNLLVGTPEQVAEGLRSFTSVGVTYFILRFCDFPRSEGALRFVEEVMPLMR